MKTLSDMIVRRKDGYIDMQATHRAIRKLELEGTIAHLKAPIEIDRYIQIRKLELEETIAHLKATIKADQGSLKSAQAELRRLK